MSSLPSTWSGRGALRECRVEAESLHGVLTAVAAALGELLRGPDDGWPDRLPVLADAGDATALLTAFVDDLVYLAAVEDFAVRRVERLELDGLRLRAAVSGETGSARAAGAAVTVRTVSLRQVSGVWQARLAVRFDL